MRITPPLVTAFILATGALTLPAQNPPAAKSVLRNGGMESSRTRDDLWDGVDSGGYLAGEREQVPILTTSGVISDSIMPVSVQVADMNGDGLPDIITMDPLGYLRIYFNSGSKTAPAFTIGEIAPCYLTRSWPPNRSVNVPIYARYAPRICLYDSQHSGKYDLYIGNYWGEIFLLPNSGSGVKPEFRQVPDPSRLAIPTAKGDVHWGNVFAPAVWDWNKDGKDDLLIGEGSYSANNIHLLLNSGSSSHPTFDDTNRAVLAFGDGREQLTPTVVDYNGDGLPDLLVAERTGKLALYLNKGGKWSPGDEIPFTSYVPLGGNANTPLVFNGIFTVTTADLNGDGLFDIVVGKTNGRVAVCYNTGTKTEPKFSAPVELKGTPVTPPLKVPNGWEVNAGLQRGNYYGYARVVTATDDPKAQPPEGQAALKFGYVTPMNKVMANPMASAYTGPIDPASKMESAQLRSDIDAPMIMRPFAANTFLLRQNEFKLESNKDYTLSFKVKGNLTAGQYFVTWHAYVPGTAASNIGDRGEVQVHGADDVYNTATGPVPSSSGWTEVKKDFKTSFNDKRMKEYNKPLDACLQITFGLTPLSGEAYIDDVKITPK